MFNSFNFGNVGIENIGFENDGMYSVNTIR